jgi:ABC-type uncharacterized transport system permease subunit
MAPRPLYLAAELENLSVRRGRRIRHRPWTSAAPWHPPEWPQQVNIRGNVVRPRHTQAGRRPRGNGPTTVGHDWWGWVCGDPGAHFAENPNSAAVGHSGAGAVVFGHDILVYLAFVILAVVVWCIRYTHLGLVLWAVGGSLDAAHALGYAVIPIRYAAVAFGGALAGLAGAYMSLAYTPLWAQDTTAGRGWVAVALVTFSAWRPFWLLIRAWFFGALMYLSLYVQALLSAVPYIGTVVALVLISRDARRIRLHRPAMLGRPFQARV